MADNSIYLDRKNALRYMGFRGEPDKVFSAAVAECEAELSKAMTPRCVWVVRERSSLKEVLLGFDVYRHLRGCPRVIVLAATLGSATDALIRKYQAVDVTKALITDAEASAAIEKYCDYIEEEIAGAVAGNLTWRFSPGYGDFPLEAQTALLTVADAERKIGLFSGESYMLAPAKSVTAVIGLSGRRLRREKNSCAVCGMKDTCEYRKEGTRCGYE